MRKRKGYISIEMVLLFTLVFIFGILSVKRFVLNGQAITDKENTVYETVSNTVYESVGTGSIIPGPPIGGGGGGGSSSEEDNKTYEMVGYNDFINIIENSKLDGYRVGKIHFTDQKMPESGVTVINGLDADGDNGVVGWYTTYENFIYNTETEDWTGQVTLADIYISSQKSGQEIIYPYDDCESMFFSSTYCEKIDLNNIIFPNMSSAWNMFGNVGFYAKKVEISGIRKNTMPSITDIFNMFFCIGNYAEEINIDLTNLTMSNVTEAVNLFARAGANAKKVYLGDLSKWDVSNLENANSMFGGFSREVKELNIGDISNWNTSKLTNANVMFSSAFMNTDSVELDLSGWDFSNITNMSSFISSTGATKIKLPKNINPSATMTNITSQTWYDETDNYKEYPAGTIPTGFAESHTLVKNKPI